MEEAAAEMMDEFVERLRRESGEIAELGHLDTLLVVGLPVTRILEVAKKSRAQLIVMGSQGRTGLSHLLLGSKAEKVVQLSPVPVTIVKLPEPANTD
jgi:nucleotide-binding universal stress UspA family protein